MKALLAIWRSPWRRRLHLPALALLVAGVASGGIVWREYSRGQAAALEQEAGYASWAANSLLAADVDTAAAGLADRMRAVTSLREAGFGGPADRVAWVEGAIAALERIKPLDYTVEVGAAVRMPIPDAMLAWFSDRGMEPPALETNDLKLQARGLVEDEVLRVLEAAVATGGGITRVERCKLERRPDGLGVDIDCLLRRHGLVPAIGAPAS